MKSTKRTIAVVTGTRADYPRLKAVLKEIAKRKSLKLKIIATGMHLMEEFGYTLQEIMRDGFKIDCMSPMFSHDDSPLGMVKALAKGTSGIANSLHKLKPDILLVTVDRVETLAAAQAGAFMNICIAHIQGGEVTGTIDESIRHATTKLAHLHFPATKDAAERIIKMGENPKHVFRVGCPYIDVINNIKYKSKNVLAHKYCFDSQKDIIIFTYHPVTSEYGEGVKQYLTVVAALKEFPEYKVINIYSNADAGGRAIIRQIKKTEFHCFENISSEDFLSFLKCAKLMIGNSSAGIREAPSFHLPVVNVGTRQQGRLRAENVIDVPCEKLEIVNGIKKALYDNVFLQKAKKCKNPYGDGHSAKRIVDVLETIKITPSLIQKKICY